MIKVEICSVTGSSVGMAYKALDRYEKFCQWAKQYPEVKYTTTENCRVIELDDKDYTLFVLTYQHEYKKI